ncbi:hypothetical protein SEA_EVAMON_2 [Gordonia phage Evamon]|nr:hypothetical protein KNV01_gp02 [Gordonia phage Evamon]QJD51497.1 hypothetical protein SEA_EVAMON_2 [Gordonia phage Evamon]
MKPPPWPAKPKSQARMAIIDADGNRTPIRSALVDFQMTPDPAAVEQFREAWDGFRTTVVEGFRTLEVSFQGVSADLRRVLEGSFAEGGEVVEQSPQQRALPRPSTTPPMWAARADGRRRR